MSGHTFDADQMHAFVGSVAALRAQAGRQAGMVSAALSPVVDAESAAGDGLAHAAGYLRDVAFAQLAGVHDEVAGIERILQTVHDQYVRLEAEIAQAAAGL